MAAPVRSRRFVVYAGMDCFIARERRRTNKNSMRVIIIGGVSAV